MLQHAFTSHNRAFLQKLKFFKYFKKTMMYIHRMYSYDKALSAKFFRAKLFNPEVQLAQNLNTKFLRARINFR